MSEKVFEDEVPPIRQGIPDRPGGIFAGIARYLDLPDNHRVWVYCNILIGYLPLTISAVKCQLRAATNNKSLDHTLYLCLSIVQLCTRPEHSKA
jgi:hypothetical protein